VPFDPPDVWKNKGIFTQKEKDTLELIFDVFHETEFYYNLDYKERDEIDIIREKIGI